MEEMIRKATARAEPHDAFSEITLVDDDDDGKGKGEIVRTWLGHLYTDDDHTPEQYCRLRHELSEAAYFGRWPTLWEILEEARDRFDESWVNATRMSMIP
jgi:hypothetical protein